MVMQSVHTSPELYPSSNRLSAISGGGSGFPGIWALVSLGRMASGYGKRPCDTTVVYSVCKLATFEMLLIQAASVSMTSLL